jgi:acyl homoserine lactone synthase
MILSVSIENAHLYGDIIPSIYRLRHHGFKERQSYNVPSYNGMEYDAYDTPATHYIAWRDESNVVRGCARLFPTTQPYMIEHLWPQSVAHEALPRHPRIWEASRMCIDKSLPPQRRRLIHGMILCGLLEFGLARDIDWMIGVMALPIWRSVFIRAGWPIEFLGPPVVLGPRESIYAGKMNISEHILTSVREKFAIDRAVICPDETGGEELTDNEGGKIRA